jgi:hypothetical protein
MHSAIVLAIGFALLGACALVGFLLGGNASIASAALVFVPFWLIGAGINLYLGVKTAGYSLADEAPIFLVVFAVPALVALVLWWQLH